MFVIVMWITEENEDEINIEFVDLFENQQKV